MCSLLQPVGQARALWARAIVPWRPGFDPAEGPGSGEEFCLPVDSPDAEHAVSAVMSNAVAFTTKVRLGSVLPVAFLCVGVSERE